MWKTPSTPTMAPLFNVAVLLYQEADLVDFAGPLEVYSTFPPPGQDFSFKTMTFALQKSIRSTASVLTMTPDASFEEVEAKLESYDILIVPGAVPETILDMLKRDDGKAIVQLLQRFASLPPRDGAGHRIIQSVCTGAFFLGAAGILAQRTVTTHHMGYEVLKQLTDEAAGGDSGTVVAMKRWADAGQTDAGVRIVTAGGVTSGLDASLYVIEMLAGKERADYVASIVEFERRSQDDAWGTK